MAIRTYEVNVRVTDVKKVKVTASSADEAANKAEYIINDKYPNAEEVHAVGTLQYPK